MTHLDDQIGTSGRNGVANFPNISDAANTSVPQQLKSFVLLSRVNGKIIQLPKIQDKGTIRL